MTEQDQKRARWRAASARYHAAHPKRDRSQRRILRVGDRCCLRCGGRHEANGLCSPCSQWRKKHGTDRPWSLINKDALAEIGVRRCRCCKELRHFTDFDSAVKGSGDLQTDCRRCHTKRRQEKARNRPLPPLVPLVCEQCHDIFYRRYFISLMRFCGKACGARWWVQNNRERRKSHAQRRNAKERGAVRTGPVVRKEIFARDNWICGLCRGQVDCTLKFPHRMSATLDHILPLSKGGSHEPSNVQLAHFACNCRKKDRAA